MIRPPDPFTVPEYTRADRLMRGLMVGVAIGAPLALIAAWIFA